MRGFRKFVDHALSENNCMHELTFANMYFFVLGL